MCVCRGRFVDAYGQGVDAEAGMESITRMPVQREREED